MRFSCLLVRSARLEARQKMNTKAFFLRVVQAGLTLKSKRASLPEPDWNCKRLR
jgi:hypothetical protein